MPGNDPPPGLRIAATEDRYMRHLTWKPGVLIAVSALFGCGSGGSSSSGASVGGSGNVPGLGGAGGSAASGASGGYAGVAAAGAGAGGSAGAPGGTGGSAGSAGSGGGDSGLVISELMYNPQQVSDSVGEYIELANTGAVAVDLSGYSLTDASQNTHVIQPGSGLHLGPGEFALLARNGDVSNNGGLVPTYVYENIYLPNSGGSITLKDPQGQTVASVSYGVAAPWPNQQSGRSIELVSLGSDPQQGASWGPAENRYGVGDKGTPGGPNGYGPEPFVLDVSDLGWQDPNLKASLFFSYFGEPETAILKALDGAKSSVHMAMFNLRASSIIAKLGALKTSGVDVVILMDEDQKAAPHNQAKLQEMAQLGLVPIGIPNTSAQNSAMHNKFVVIDGATVLTGSMNYSSNALNLNDEELLRIDSTAAAAIFETEFVELKNQASNAGTVPTSSPLQIKFGSEDGLWNLVEQSIANAKSSVHVAMFSFSHSGLKDELIAAKQKGLHVLVLFDKLQAENTSVDEDLEAAGVVVRRFENTRGGSGNLGLVELHNKLCVVDGSRVLLGSYNWTNLASYFNDENLVILDSPELAAHANSELADMLNDYVSSFDPTSVGLSGGARTVTFKVRAVTVDADAELYLVGGVPELGSWNYSLAKKMTLQGGSASVSVSLAAGTTVQYRFFVRSKDRHHYTELDAARRFTVPYASGEALLDHAFDKRLD